MPRRSLGKGTYFGGSPEGWRSQRCEATPLEEEVRNVVVVQALV
jgi:hypothetical protein